MIYAIKLTGRPADRVTVTIKTAANKRQCLILYADGFEKRE